MGGTPEPTFSLGPCKSHIRVCHRTDEQVGLGWLVGLGPRG